LVAAGFIALAAQMSIVASPRDERDRLPARALDVRLAKALDAAGFTGAIESTLERRLGRRINARLADLGRLLWFDTLHSLHHDNTCGGCHSPTNGFGDSQGMAIGVQNNGVVGPDRAGPRNQRRSPLVINTAFLSALMWNGRFSAPSGDPFDNSLGFRFPPPEDDVRFPPGSPTVTTPASARYERICHASGLFIPRVVPPTGSCISLERDLRQNKLQMIPLSTTTLRFLPMAGGSYFALSVPEIPTSMRSA